MIKKINVLLVGIAISCLAFVMVQKPTDEILELPEFKND